MRKRHVKMPGRLGKGVVALALACGVGVGVAAVGTAEADNATWWGNETITTVDINNNLLKTYGVRAGSAGGDFLGITNTNFDFTSGKASQTTQYTDYTDSTTYPKDSYKFAGLALWASSVNTNPNPYYKNLFANALSGTTAATQATTWMSNPETSSWGDSNGQASHVGNVDSGAATIAGLEYSPDIIFGANKTTNWNLASDGSNSGTNMATETAKSTTYNPTYVTNDATNIFTQIYTMGQLATTADTLVANSVGEDGKATKATRYNDSDATESAVAYENATRGQMLYVASQIDQKKVERKKVAYLYAIEGDTGYFFVPTADGLTTGNDSSKSSGNSETNPDSNYAANNSTINMGYMATLPFVTDTFDSGKALEGGIVMKVEDIYKSNPTCTVGTGSATDVMEDVDYIIYNSTTATSLKGTSGGKNSSEIGVTNTPLTDTNVKTWAAQYGFKGSVLAGDDFGTSTNQGIGDSREASENGTAPLLYCQRNYTADKDVRAAWVFSKVFPELYGDNSNATYGYWVNNVYHINTDSVAGVVKYMTSQSGTVTYTAATNKTVEDNARTGYNWWFKTGSKSDTWSKYAYYNGSSRASYYNKDATAATAAEEPKDTIGIFAPSSLIQQEANVERIAGSGDTEAAGTAVEISKKAFADGSCDTVIIARDDDFADAMAASGLAGALNNGNGAPILLVNRESGLTNQSFVKDEITRLGAKNAYIIGGKGAIPADLESQLKAINVTAYDRVYGNEAADTSVQCASKISSVLRETEDDYEYAIVAISDNFQDALSMSSFAYAYKVPIILETSGATAADRKLPSGASTVLNQATKQVLIAGGTGALADSSLTSVTAKTERIWGQTGYDTSNKIAKWMLENKLLTAENACVACGAINAKGTDALAGAALAGKNKGVMLLTNSNEGIEAVDLTTISGSAATAEQEAQTGFMTDNKASFKNVYILGGTAVCTPDMMTSIETLLGVTSSSAAAK